VTDAHDPLPLRLNSQGLPLPGMTIGLLDLITRQPLPPGEIGQLAVGGCVTPGYFNAPELDAEAVAIAAEELLDRDARCPPQAGSSSDQSSTKH
jgi:hypothetical protein